MKIAIVDDQYEDRAALLNLLKLYFNRCDFPVEYEEYTDGESFLKNVKPGNFDLVFLDIIMDGIDGMKAARVLYRTDPSCLAVFLTVSPDFAIMGYDVHAYQYILKPVERKTLWKLLTECVRKIRNSARQLRVKIDRQDLEIPFSRILYTMTAGRNVEIHLDKETLKLSSHIPFSRTVEPLLDDFRFVVCSRGLVINMEHADRLLKDSFLMDTGEIIPISRREYLKVRSKYMTYSFDEY